MKNFSLKQAFSCAATEFVKWVCDARMVIVAVLLIFINNFAVSPLTNNAELMGEPLNILEPFIAVANSEILILIIPIVFLTLIADYPKVDTNTVFYIVRIGRANWFVGQILKLVFMIVSYLAVIFLGTVLPMLSKGFWYNGWSNVATGFVKMFPDRRGDFGVELLPENLYNQLSVFEAAVKSYLLVAAYLMIIGLILLVFSLFKRKTVGFIICGGMISLGMAFLCGIFVPREFLSDTVMAIAHFLPAYWYANATDAIDNFTSGSSVIGIFVSMGVQVLFAVLFTLVGVIVDRYKTAGKAMA